MWADDVGSIQSFGGGVTMKDENQNEIVESQNTEIAPEQRYYNGPVTLEEAESYITSGLVSTARNYVAIGYWLRRIRDGKLYEEEGHQNFEQYVHEKYGKDKGWASKCIKVNQQLSKDGDSPLLDSRYRDYSTYQLVELAYMTEEQREQATPEQTIKQLQEIRKPKEIPYYEIPGQFTMGEVSLEDFLGAAEEPATVKDPETPDCPECSSSESHTIRPEDFFPASQPGECIHRPGFACTLPEGAKQSPGTGADCSTHCCWDCVKHGDCRLECHASAGREGRIATSQRILEEVEQERAAETQQKEAGCCENRSGGLSAYGTPARIYPADSLIATAGCEGGHDCFSCSAECGIRKKDRWCVEAPCGNPFPCEILPHLEEVREHVRDTCEFTNHDLAYHRAGDGEPDPCCKHCKEPCGYICGRAMNPVQRNGGNLCP